MYVSLHVFTFTPHIVFQSYNTHNAMDNSFPVKLKFSINKFKFLASKTSALR